MKDHIIRRIEADVVFQELLTQEEKFYILRILRILAVYVILESHMLGIVYEQFYHEKLRLKFIKKAARERFVIEYLNKGVPTEEKVYFYELKSGGIHILNKAGYYHIEASYRWTNLERSALLEYNRECISNNEFLTELRDYKQQEALTKELYRIARQKVSNDEFGKYTKAVNPTMIKDKV